MSDTRLPTEPIDSIPRPDALLAAVAAYGGEGRSLEPMLLGTRMAAERLGLT